MQRAILVLLCSLLVGMVGCGATAKSPRYAEDAPVDLARLADEIDPGALPPLTENMPTWLRVALAGSVAAQPIDPAILSSELGSRLRNLAGSGQLSQENLIGLLAAIYALGQVESGGACNLACLSASEKAYDVLDVPMLADPDGFMGDLIDLAIQAMKQQGEDATQLVEVIDFVRGVIRAAPAHQRRVAARILRLAPDSLEATESLRHLADRDSDDGNTGRALQLRRLVAERARPLGFDDAIEVTRACVHQLRLDCARTWHARATALAAEPDDHTALDFQRENLTRVARVLEIGDAAPLEPALERTHLLIEIGQSRRATPELERLRAANPADARPVVGLVRASFDQIMRTQQAAALLAQARPLANHDQAFYELALGMFFTQFMGDILPKLLADPDRVPALIGSFLPQLRADVDGLGQFAPARAAVLAIVIDHSRKFLPLAALPEDEQQARFGAIARSALVEARAVRVRFPDEPDAHRLALLLARFGGAARGDYGVVTDPLPPGIKDGAELAIMRAGLFASLVVAWEDPAQLPALHAAIDALVDAPAHQARIDDLRAAVLVLDATLGGRADAWPRAEAAYRARIAIGSTEELPRLHNNLGVALWHQGKRDDAFVAWRTAITGGDPQAVARLNLRVAEPLDDETLGLLTEIGETADRSSTRYQALRWYAIRSGLTGPALAEAQAKAGAVLSREGFGVTVSGDRGVILDESFSFGLGYSSTKGLVTNFALTADVWLVLSAPAS